MLDMSLLAQADISTLLSSPLFKTYATYLLVIIAGLALFYPTALEKLKVVFRDMVENAVKQHLLVKDGDAKPGDTPFNLPTIQSIIEALLKDRLLPKTGEKVEPGQAMAAVLGEQSQSITDLVQQHAMTLKSICPNASPDLRLKWLEKGYDATRAQADYIAVLEGRLTAATVNPPALSPPEVATAV